MDETGGRLAREILQQAPDAIIYADRSGVIREWNAKAETMFGYSPAEAVGQSLDLIIPERLRAAHWKGFENAVESGRTVTAGRAIRTRATPKDGARLYVEMSFSLVTDQGGHVVGAVAIARESANQPVAGESKPPGT